MSKDVIRHFISGDNELFKYNIYALSDFIMQINVFNINLVYTKVMRVNFSEYTYIYMNNIGWLSIYNIYFY